MDHPPRIAITMGDPAGIGPEIIIKAFADPSLCRVCRPLVVGDAGRMREEASRLESAVTVRPLEYAAEARYEGGILNVLDLGNLPRSVAPGRASAEGGKASVEYIRKAAGLAMNHEAEAVTTAPISKEAIHLGGYPYPGHTEMLADFTGTRDVALMMVGDKLRVVLATTHAALKDVGALLTEAGLMRTIRLTHRWLCQYADPRPRIALTGLNPHCGDGGIFGREESEVILPAVQKSRAEGLGVEGPFPADALFARARTGEYHAVIAMYHDQGMIPVKMEAPGHAVNITLGLPILRTSVDHGTAYDIAGTGTASPESLIHAAACAARLAHPIPTL